MVDRLNQLIEFYSRRITLNLCAYLENELSFNKSNYGVNEFNSADFILTQINLMPDYLRTPFKLLIIFFGLHTILIYGTHFPALSLGRKSRVLLLWRHSPFNFSRDFLRFYEALIVFNCSARKEINNA